jgi:hypothetical protein
MLAQAIHAGEHPEYHDATRLAALRRFQRPGSCRSWIVSQRLNPRFRGDDTLAWSVAVHSVSQRRHRGSLSLLTLWPPAAATTSVSSAGAPREADRIHRDHPR